MFCAGVPRVFTDRPLPFGPEAFDALSEETLSEMAAPVVHQHAAFECCCTRTGRTGECLMCCGQRGRDTYVHLPGNERLKGRETEIATCTAQGSKGTIAGEDSVRECVCFGAKEMLLPVLRHMQSCRINISIRAVR
jgi:hypothetical protein